MSVRELRCICWQTSCRLNNKAPLAQSAELVLGSRYHDAYYIWAHDLAREPNEPGIPAGGIGRKFGEGLLGKMP